MVSGESDLQIAARVLTERQLQVWKLREVQGIGWRQMSVMLGVSTATVRDAHATALRKIGKEIADVED